MSTSSSLPLQSAPSTYLRQACSKVSASVPSAQAKPSLPAKQRSTTWDDANALLRTAPGQKNLFVSLSLLFSLQCLRNGSPVTLSTAALLACFSFLVTMCFKTTMNSEQWTVDCNSGCHSEIVRHAACEHPERSQQCTGAGIPSSVNYGAFSSRLARLKGAGLCMVGKA